MITTGMATPTMAITGTTATGVLSGGGVSQDSGISIRYTLSTSPTHPQRWSCNHPPRHPQPQQRVPGTGITATLRRDIIPTCGAVPPRGGLFLLLHCANGLPC